MSAWQKVVIALVTIILVFMLVVSMVSNTRAVNIEEYKYKYHYKMLPVKQLDNATFLREYILKRLPEDAKLIHFETKIVYFNDRNTVKLNSSSTSHRGISRYYITNVSGPYEMWGTHYIDTNEGSGPGSSTIFMLGRESIPNLFNTNTNATANVISKGVGFSVTKIYNPVVKCSLSIHNNTSGAIEVYPIYDVYHYDVMYKPLIGKAYKVGKGDASKAVGIFYLKYIWK